MTMATETGTGARAAGAVRPSIVCVDDEPVVLTSLRRQLREIAPEHRIEVATSGADALELLAKIHDDRRQVPLLVSDQMMPGMTGDELLSQAAARFPETYQVMLTGQATAEAVGRAVNNGRLFRFLSKPWSVDDLRLTVTKAIEAYERDGALRRQTEALERAHRRSLDFVPDEYLRMLGRDRLEDVRRGDALATRLSVMFADMRGFTTLIESMGPEQSYAFMNTYFERTEPAVVAHGGFVDHYAGDGTMAVFPVAAVQAVRATIDFARAVDAMNVERESSGLGPIEIGIGLHTGEVVVGVCGGGRKLQCGVVGDAVNLAARIEGMTSRYGARVLVSEETRACLGEGEAPELREVDRVRAKGKREPVTIFEVLDALPAGARAARLSTRGDFEAGLRAMRAGDAATALASFARVVALDPNDRAGHVHLDTCHDLLRGRVAVGPDGVLTLHEKRW